MPDRDPRYVDPDFPKDTLAQWESLTAFIDQAEAASAHRYGDRASHSYSLRDDRFADAMHLARTGWPEGHARMVDATRRLYERVRRTQNTENRLRVRRSVAGHVPNVPAYLAGHPQQFLRFERQPVSSPVIEIVAGTNYMDGTPAERVFRRGAAICALTDLLTHAGRPVEIWGYKANGSPRSDMRMDLRYRVKRSTERLNLDSMAFVFANASSQRHLNFSVVETFLDAAEWKRYGGPASYGSDPRDAREHRRGDVHVPSHDSRATWATDGAAERWLMDELREQGIEISEAA